MSIVFHQRHQRSTVSEIFIYFPCWCGLQILAVDSIYFASPGLSQALEALPSKGHSRSATLRRHIGGRHGIYLNKLVNCCFFGLLQIKCNLQILGANLVYDHLIGTSKSFLHLLSFFMLFCCTLIKRTLLAWFELCIMFQIGTLSLHQCVFHQDLHGSMHFRRSVGR